MSFLNQPLSLFSISSRSFGEFKNYVTISESSTDALEITQQPVQQGAAIADHAFVKPSNFSIQIMFSDSLFQSLEDIYDDLLTLQASLEPFDCVTPKRTYFNMLMASLSQTTDKNTEAVLSINASFQEVIIVPIVTTIVPRSQLRSAGTNGATQSAGRKSAIKILSGAVG